MDDGKIKHRINQLQKAIQKRQDLISRLKLEIVNTLLDLDSRTDLKLPSSDKIIIHEKNEKIKQLFIEIQIRQERISRLKSNCLHNLLDKLTQSITPTDRALLAIHAESYYRNVTLPLTHRHLKYEIWFNYSIIPVGVEIDKITKKLAQKVFSIMHKKVHEILDGTKALGVNIPRDLERHLTIFHCFRPEKKDRVRISMIPSGSIELHISSTDRVSGTYQRIINKSSDLAQILTKDQLELIIENPEIIDYFIEEDCHGFERSYQQIETRPPFILNLP